MSNRVVAASKKLAAQRQIHAAIAHYRKGDFECAITLASAAEGQIPEPNARKPSHLFGVLKDYLNRTGEPTVDFNYMANWLKHGWGLDETDIADPDVTFWLNRAISKYRAVYGSGTDEMASFVPLRNDPDRDALSC